MEALLGLAAPAIGGLFNFMGTTATNQNNQQMLAQQEAYQTQMSNTAYQRASADMKAAGLNPMMMFGSGGPASTPSAPASAPRTSGLSTVGSAIQTGVNNLVTAKTIDKMSDEIALLKAQRATEALRPGAIAASTAVDVERKGLVGAETQATKERAEDIRQDAALKRQTQILRGPDTMEASGVLGLPTSVLERAGQIKYGAGTLGDLIGTGVSSAVGVRGLVKSLKPRRTTEETTTSKFDGGSSTFKERFEH